MIIPNMHYADLKESYLFYNIAQKTKAYVEAHPGTHLYRMGIGDVSLPLCDASFRHCMRRWRIRRKKNGFTATCRKPARRF